MNGADVSVPENARALVLFAHGSGSSRHSPRNRYVAQTLNQAGLATVLMDLLTPAEEAADRQSGHLRFDIELLAHRLVAATRWVKSQERLAGLPLGYFGASTGAAAALVAAAKLGETIGAVVSRGGRPDLAGDALEAVMAPTLLIVGGDDTVVIALNKQAACHLRAPHELAIVPKAGHLFEEPGALEEVARLSSAWFERYLAADYSPLG